MTIAAGFVHNGGILLCSDTQQEGGAIKIHGPKIGHFEYPGGKLAFAIAGNARFGISAAQKCEVALESVKPEKAITELEKVLEREYRRVVYEHPDYGKDDFLPYWLLISLWSRATATTSLFMTSEHVLFSSFERFQAVGTGFELATVLARPFMFDDLGEEESLILAAYMLARVKDNVPGCGGESQFICMRNDGSADPIAKVSLDQIAGVAAAYDKAAHQLLFSMVGNDNDRFEEELVRFGGYARLLRDIWRKVRAGFPEAQRSPQSTTTDPSHLPPSQE